MHDPTLWKARELEILQLMADSLTNGEIAARLNLAQETIRWYNKQIFEKLEVTNRAQAVKRAAEFGLIQQAHTATDPDVPLRSAIRYTASGDVHIAYRVVGGGPVDLLFIHGFLSHVELGWEDPDFASFFDQLGRTARVILFDKRGVGLSDRMLNAPTLENTIDDAISVLDAVGAQRVIVMGISEGGAAAALLAATYPEHVSGLILYGATAKLVQTNGEPAWAEDAQDFENSVDRMQKTWGEPYAIEWFAPSRAYDPQFREWWSRVLRTSSSPSSVGAVFRALRDVDIRELLPQIYTRTLVMHKSGDRMVHIDAGRYLADHLPNAQWVELPGADHFYFVDSAGAIAEITRFLEEGDDDASSETLLTTVLCVADDGEALDELTLLREISDYRGRVALDEGGLIALFDGPTRAVDCARTLARLSPFRIAVHVGECRINKGQPEGILLEIVAHIAEQAEPGEVLISRTLRDILAGSDFVFASREVNSHSPLLEGFPIYTLV